MYSPYAREARPCRSGCGGDIFHRVSTLAEIEASADALPTEQKEQLLAFLAARLGWTLYRKGAGTSGSVRRAGGQSWGQALPEVAGTV